MYLHPTVFNTLKSKLIPIKAIEKDKSDFSAKVIPEENFGGNLILLPKIAPIIIAIATEPYGYIPRQNYC